MADWAYLLAGFNYSCPKVTAASVGLAIVGGIGGKKGVKYSQGQLLRHCVRSYGSVTTCACFSEQR